MAASVEPLGGAKPAEGRPEGREYVAGKLTIVNHRSRRPLTTLRIIVLALAMGVATFAASRSARTSASPRHRREDRPQSMVFLAMGFVALPR